MQEEEERRKQELKSMIKEIQEEVQVKVTGQVVSMMKTFIGDVGCLLRHLLKRGNIGDPSHGNTMETARMLQVLNNFNLGDSESGSDSEKDESAEGGSTKGTKKGGGRYSQYPNACKCGKAVRQYQTGRTLYEVK